MTVPNGDLARAQLVNVSARASTWFHQRISVPVDVPSAQLEALLAELMRRVGGHPLVETAPGLPRVRVVALGTGRREIEIEIVARVLANNEPGFLEAPDSLVIGILRSIEADGIRLA